MTASEWVVAVVAVLGLGLSLYNTITARSQRRTRLRVHLSLSAEPPVTEPSVALTVYNASSHEVSVKVAGLEAGGVAVTLDQLGVLHYPRPILARDDYTVFFWATEAIAHGIGTDRRVVAFATDASGKMWRSKPQDWPRGEPHG